MKKRSIHQKLTRSYVILISAVALMMLVGFLLTLYLSVLPNMRLTMESKANELENRVSEQIAYLERAADTAFLDLNDISYDVLHGKSGELQRYNQINQGLYLMRQVYSDVKWAFLFDTEGNVYADNILIEHSLKEGFDASLHQRIEENHGRTVSFGLCTVPGLNDGEPVLLVGKMVRYVSNLEKIGYLYIAADRALLYELFGEQIIADSQNIYLCDAEGIVRCSTEEGAEGTKLSAAPGAASDGLITRYNGRSWLCQQKYVESMDAVIVLMIPVLELYRSSAVSIQVIIISALLGLVVALYESGSITKRVLDPLRELTDKVNEISAGNMDVRCDTGRSDDEIGLLSTSFNGMLDRIAELIKRVEWEQKDKLKTELAVQQNRIQPHFLYNTLNTICALCDMERAEDASRMAHLVAGYYRMVLSDGKDVVTMEQELRHVEQYLQILQIRRGDRLSYSISCEDGAGDFLIPKMTLQPLVENAAKHAFSDGRPGEIGISVSVEEDEAVIRVTDNGVGMDEKVFEDIVKNREQGHFGIYSVCRRMQLLTGGDYKLEARSSPEAGTQVTLRYDAARLSEDSGADAE